MIHTHMRFVLHIGHRRLERPKPALSPCQWHGLCADYGRSVGHLWVICLPWFLLAAPQVQHMKTGCTIAWWRELVHISPRPPGIMKLARRHSPSMRQHAGCSAAVSGTRTEHDLGIDYIFILSSLVSRQVSFQLGDWEAWWNIDFWWRFGRV